jgi:hypothetical protein
MALRGFPIMLGLCSGMGFLLGTLMRLMLSSIGGGVLNSLVTAKGDLVAASASSTPDNLAVGTDGQYLKAASGETLGLDWAGLDVVIGVACSDETTDLATGTAAW